ncbi:MAG: TlpA family protein disulfide reductase, partial [Bacteroidia bacterium]
WASWCGPCRRDNPGVVAVYNKFKDARFKSAKSFTIYSVSLDHTKSKWEEAIEADQLSWPYHVSDLKGWNNAAATKYAVLGIPTNYLLDANGIIIAKGLKEAELVKTLESLVAK